MHGIETIHQLNELASQNANAAETLAAAEKYHEGKPSAFDGHYAEAVANAKAERENRIKELETKSLRELVDILKGLQYPSILEAALTRKLDSYVNGEHQVEYQGGGHA